ncbi:MAG: signal recognition particle-docking protein FtsY [Betaproteobacteria bacterium]|nr:signal recognition particle-docking protein FtsY [Betaproteobacteria bacterium]
MFDFLKKLFKGDESKKTDSKPVKKTTKPKTEPKKTAVTKSKTVKKESVKKTKPKNEEKQLRPDKKIETDSVIEKEGSPNKEEKLSFAEKIKQGLKKTRDAISENLSALSFTKKIDQEFYDELEMTLIAADVGYAATQQIITELKDRVKKEKLEDGSELKDLLKKILSELLKQIEKPLIHIKTTPFVILVVGVNGAGKTTTIGKLTKLLLDEGKSVLIAAGDTFRAAAKEQLQVWGDRNNVTVISQNTGDPSAVIFDAMQSAKAKGIDIVIADTAGRLPTQKHLIDELAKIKKVIQKFDETAPHETILVLDANTGQNAINQIKVFNEAVSLTGLIMTKLDGTAKGGIVAAIAKEQPIPLRFIGVGEKIDDLKIFSAEDYVEGMLE